MAGLKAAPKKGKKTRKYLRNRDKCKRYRDLVGKPRGRGVAGNKSGANFKPMSKKAK